MEMQFDSIDISQLKAIALGKSNSPVLRATTATIQSAQIPKLRNSQDVASSCTTVYLQRLSSDLEQRQWHNRRLQQLDDAESPSVLPSVAPYITMESTKPNAHSNSTPSDGDTQPVSQWVYDTKENASIIPNAPLSTVPPETGLVNLLEGFEQEVGAREETNLHSEEDDEDDVQLVSQDIRAEPFPETMRFRPPATPLTHSTKRKRLDQGNGTEIETPRLPNNPFAGLNVADVMNPSQIFQATQAQTSPHLLHSDMLYERPSPNVHNLGRSLAVGSSSSPVMIMAQNKNNTRAVPEPQATYISMKESQEARERQLQEMRRKQDELSEDEFSQPSGVQLARNPERDYNTRDAKIQLTRRSTPRDSFDDPKSMHRDSAQKRRTVSSARWDTEAVVISDDAALGDSQENITEDETEREEEKDEKVYDNEIDELAEDNKENIEVPMTVSRPYQSYGFMSQISPSRNHVRSRTRSLGATSATQVRGSPCLPKSPIREPGLACATQVEAIRDSQSSQQHNGKRQLAGSKPYAPRSSPESYHVPPSQLSQKSKPFLVPSSGPEKVTVAGVSMPLISSSPLVLNRMSFKESGLKRISREELSAEYEKSAHSTFANPAGEIIYPRNVLNSEESSKSEESQNVIDTVSSPQASTSHRIPEKDSTTISAVAKDQVIPNSSYQDISSSGRTPPSIPNTATNQVSNRQSHNTTLYETAPEKSSASPSKDYDQSLRIRSTEDGLTSPSKHLRCRTLEEIAADPSPPDLLEDMSILDIDLLSKEDEEFNKTVRRTDLIKPIVRKRKVQTSTRWKNISSEPPSDYLGTPVGPTFSQVSAVLEAQESESQDFSPLSTPPASQYQRSLSTVVAKDIDKPLTATNAVSSDKEPAPLPRQDLLAPDPSRLSSTILTSTRQKSRSHPIEMQPRLIPQTRNTQPPVTPDAAILDDSPAIVAPDRVFAHFNGRQSAYYTATCLGVISGEEPRYSIHYDDGAEDSISAAGVKRLELRHGDVVKVDLPPYRSKNYVVVGMQDKQSLGDYHNVTRRRKVNPEDKAAWPEVDIHGYEKVLLAPKQKDANSRDHTEGEQIAVGLYHLYLTQAMWTNIRDREYAHVDRRARAVGGLQTPSEHPSTTSSPTPRTKRGKSNSLAQSTSTKVKTRGLFNNMVFTLTNISQATDLEHTKTLIVNEGGKVLEEGFDTLFHVPTLHRITSPKKSDSDRQFHLSRQAQNVGFTCLLADKYCRRAKYIQALALGIPCLASRWVSDCVSKQRILPWSAYLLPAGESTFLGGAARSRVLPSCLAETATLSTMIEQRSRMLAGASILLIMSKAEEDTMRQHPLLTFSLHPTRVARVLTIEAAARAVAESQAVGEPWDWVFSYDREQDVERILFGSAAKKWRSGGGSRTEQEVKTKVIGNEFLIQSLILGQLAEV